MGLVVMRQELGPVGGDIDVGRALRFARLTRQTQVKRPLHLLVAPSVSNRFALEHLPQQAGATARAVLLLARRHVTGTHRAVEVLAALAKPDAAHRRLREGSVVVRE